jgi:Domain of unknown function (DUF4440)
MKKHIKHALLFALALLLVLPVFSQSKEDAIKKVCIAETQAWLDADLNAWAATHAQHENETAVFTNPDGTFSSLVGWDNIYKAIKAGAATAKKSDDKLSDENFSYIIQTDMAFVTYDQTLTATDGKVLKSRENRSLILKDGQWKIVAVLAFYDNSGDKK